MTPWISESDFPSILDYRVLNQATASKDPDELEVLSKHPDPNVRARVAENARTPLAILEGFAADNSQYSEYVKQYLIRNPIVPYSMFKNMMRVEHIELRKRIYNKLLEGYKRGLVELTGEEVPNLLRELMPNMNDLEFIDLLEAIHETRDAEVRKRV